MPIIDHFSLVNLFSTTYHWATLLGGSSFAMYPIATQQIYTQELITWSTDISGVETKKSKGFPTLIDQHQYNRFITFTHAVISLNFVKTHINTSAPNGDTTSTTTWEQAKTVEEWASKRVEFDGDDLIITNAETRSVDIKANAYIDSTYKRSDVASWVTSATDTILTISGIDYNVEYKHAPSSTAQTLFSVHIPAMSVNSNQVVNLPHTKSVGITSSLYPRPFSMGGTVYTPGIMKDPTNVLAEYPPGIAIANFPSGHKRLFSPGENLYQDVGGKLYRDDTLIYTPEAAVTTSLGTVLTYGNAIGHGVYNKPVLSPLYIFGNASYSNTHQIFTEHLNDIDLVTPNITSVQQILSGSGFDFTETFPVAAIQSAGNTLIGATQLAYVAHHKGQIGFDAGHHFFDEIEGEVWANPDSGDALDILIINDPLFKTAESEQPLFFTSNRDALSYSEINTKASYVGAPVGLLSPTLVYNTPDYLTETIRPTIIPFTSSLFVSPGATLLALYQNLQQDITGVSQDTVTTIAYGNLTSQFLFNEFFSPKSFPLLDHSIEDYMTESIFETIDLTRTAEDSLSDIFESKYYNV